MIETARLPPLYNLVPLAPHDNLLARACSMAEAGADPATILCADRNDVMACAIILQPEDALPVSQLVIYVAMLGLGDALGSVVPAGIDVTYRWPNRIDANMATVARIGLSAPSQTPAKSIPTWLVLRAEVAISPQGAHRPRGIDFETTLADEGATDVTASQLLESFSRHFLTWMGRWQDDGFAPVRAMWLRHAPSHGQDIDVTVGQEKKRGQFRDIDDDGALLVDERGNTHRISLDAYFDG